MTEKNIWRQIGPQLDARGYAYRIETATVSGFPDVIWFTRNGVMLIEMKSGPLHFRAHQKLLIRQLGNIGIEVMCIWRKKASEPIMVYRAYDLVVDHLRKQSVGIIFKEWIKAWDVNLKNPTMNCWGVEEDADT